MVQEIVRLPLAVDEGADHPQKPVWAAEGGASASSQAPMATSSRGSMWRGGSTACCRKMPANGRATVDIYPALNPLGISTMTRGIPLCDLDMNRTFPGSADGSMSEYVAARLNC